MINNNHNQKSKPHIRGHYHNTAGLGTGDLEKNSLEDTNTIVDSKIEKLLRERKQHTSNAWNNIASPSLKQQENRKSTNNLFFDNFQTNLQGVPKLHSTGIEGDVDVDPTSLTSWQICVLCLLATSGILVVLFLHVVSLDQSYTLKHVLLNKKRKKRLGGAINNSNVTSSTKKKNDDVDYNYEDAFHQHTASARKETHHNPTVVMAYSRNTTTGTRIPTTTSNASNASIPNVDRQISGLTGLGQEEDPLLLSNHHAPFYITTPANTNTNTGIQQSPFESDASPSSIGSGEAARVHHRPFMDSPRIVNPAHPVLVLSPSGIPTYLKSTASLSSQSSTSSNSRKGRNVPTVDSRSGNMEGMVLRFPSPPSSFSSASAIDDNTSISMCTSTIKGRHVDRAQAIFEANSATSPSPLVSPVVPPFSQTGLRQRRANAPDSSINTATTSSNILWNNSTEENTCDPVLVQPSLSLFVGSTVVPYLPNLKDIQENKNPENATLNVTTGKIPPPPPQTMEEIQKYTKSLSKSQIAVPNASTNSYTDEKEDDDASFIQDWNLKLPPDSKSTADKTNTATPSTATTTTTKHKMDSFEARILHNSASSIVSSSQNVCATTITFEDLKFQEIIGTGGFGQVFQATWRGTPVAVKVLSSSVTDASASQQNPEVLHHNKQLLQEFASEIAMLSSIRHPNICLYIGACVKEPNRAIITELAVNGSLWDALRKPLFTPLYTEVTAHTPMHILWPNLPSCPDCPNAVPPIGTWPWALIKKVAEGAARGMTYLHSSTPIVLHRDLKSANLLLDESYNAKVADFGLSRFKAGGSHRGASSGVTMTGNCGTVQWMPPEVLANQKYAEPADVYSYGIILWELLMKQCPYEGMNAIQCAMAVLNRGVRPEIPVWCPLPFKKLLGKCMEQNPGDRPTFGQVLLSLDAMPS